MEWLRAFLSKTQENSLTTEDDQKQKALVEQGREQFQKLIEKGLTVPVALL